MKNLNDIIFSLKEDTAYIKINRPPHNFFDTDLISQIADILELMDNKNTCRSIILYSEGKNFCAGADFSKSNFTKGKDVYADLYVQALRLFRTSKPIIAIIQGAAIGGGLGVALSADFRVTCNEAKFSANFGKLGFHQGFGTSITLPRLIGNQKAKLMLLTSKRLTGLEAFNIGLADYLVEHDQLMFKAKELAQEINSCGPLGIKAIRNTLNDGLVDQIEKIVKREAIEQNNLRNTKDFKEGINASINRRDPIFRGE